MLTSLSRFFDNWWWLTAKMGWREKSFTSLLDNISYFGSPCTHTYLPHCLILTETLVCQSCVLDRCFYSLMFTKHACCRTRKHKYRPMNVSQMSFLIVYTRLSEDITNCKFWKKNSFWVKNGVETGYTAASRPRSGQIVQFYTSLDGALSSITLLHTKCSLMFVSQSFTFIRPFDSSVAFKFALWKLFGLTVRIKSNLHCHFQ